MADSVYDVLVAGAGPTGLALAAELTRRGVRCAVVDRLRAGENTSRAAAVHARTLEVLESLDATSELIKRGLQVSLFRIRDRSRIVATVSFEDLYTKYPFVLLCPQSQTEAVLLRRLEELGGHVDRPNEVVAVRSGPDGVEVDCRSDAGIGTFRARWLAGCDGMHSVVREQETIPFEGGAYDESFALADVEMDWPLERTEVDLFFSEKGLVVVAPLPENQFRVVATVDDAAGGKAREGYAAPSISDFQQILEERGPTEGGVKIHRLIWSSRFHIQHRVAKRLRKGRVLLLGDAAHVHSPAGGQGMNTGIQDAISLASALQSVLKDGDETPLDVWEKKRLEIAHSVVSLTDRLTKVATAASPTAKLIRNTAIGIFGHMPFVQRALAEKLSELDYR
jgi:2-polyprenyl-6-methoxyphenol hydroxylase-like FAD-dependent oxidoreductase